MRKVSQTIAYQDKQQAAGTRRICNNPGNDTKVMITKGRWDKAAGIPLVGRGPLERGPGGGRAVSRGQAVSR
jgi:hypothetical protein